jgi:hypothetical protein
MSVSLSYLADEDFDNDIIRGMLRRWPNLDIVRAQDVGLSGTVDPIVRQHRKDASCSRMMSVP